MQIVIASYNQNKIRRLKKLIYKINPGIFVVDILNKQISPPPETDETQEGNLLIKLKYYSNLLNSNIICEDDAIEVKIGSKYQSIVRINQLFLDKENLFQQWSSYFQKNNITSGKLTKMYGVVINNLVKKDKIIIPLIISTHSQIPGNDKNILNNFIGPLSLGQTFYELSETEKDDYFEQQCKPAIRRLLANSKEKL